MNNTEADRIIELAATRGWLRIRDVVASGMNPESLRRLHQAGRLTRVARGIYTLPDIEPGEHHSLATAAVRVPHGVICLLSALRYHEITAQAPFEVWMAIESRARRPAASDQQTRFIRMSGGAFTEGIEEHLVEGIPVRIFNPAKTVVDCFKYRSQVGLDVALEALRECWRERRCTMDEIWHYARICRMTNVMRPYLESLQ
jgi:predicted transcriptional regulator of viral defense system